MSEPGPHITGYFIRAHIDGRWKSIDIADPRLNATQLWRWLATLEEWECFKLVRNVCTQVRQLDDKEDQP